MAGPGFWAKLAVPLSLALALCAYILQVDARGQNGNLSAALWQLAQASKETLDKQAYADMRAAMQSLKGDNGKPLNVRPTELWVPPNLEQAALEVVTAERLANGATNVMRNTAKVVVCPWLA